MKSPFEIAQQTLRLEAEALNLLANQLDQSAFGHALDLLFNCVGRVVVTGIGKSALVAQKTVATFNSTGTPALFMHAADALHGDLGMIGTGDPVICLSKSGNTPEIQALTPLLRQRGNPIIAVTAHADSALASAATVLLLLPVAQEADPLNLAPTTSTTLQMALGDALATALIARRGFTASDFARFHPGGSLGRKLYLTVGDLARLHDQPQVGIHDKLPAVILRITSGRLGATAVLDANNQLCGIVTDGDLRRALEKFGAQAYALQASEVMTPNPHLIASDILATEALHQMNELKISQLLVIDTTGQYLGMVHLHDILRTL